MIKSDLCGKVKTENIMQGVKCSWMEELAQGILVDRWWDTKRSQLNRLWCSWTKWLLWQQNRTHWERSQRSWMINHTACCTCICFSFSTSSFQTGVRLLARCLLACFERWSLRMNFRPQRGQPYFFSPVCVLLWRASSSERANCLLQFSQSQTYGFSPVCVLMWAFRWELL